MIPGFENLDSTYHHVTSVDGLANSMAGSNCNLQDDCSGSDAGTVVEKDLDLYNEPDQFGVVETFHTQDDDFDMLSEQRQPNPSE